MIKVGALRPARRRSGITLTEILIAIMILAVGIVSLATLFPLGLLRLRDATRYTRSAFLMETAASDATVRGLFNSQSFPLMDLLNLQYGFTPWFITQQSGQSYNPLIQDTPSYRSDYLSQNGNLLGANATGTNAIPRSGPGLPFAYDPLWRYHTSSTINGTPGYYIGDTYEARFGSGIGFMRPDPFDGGVPSAHGLQRLTNFNRPYTTNAQGQQIPVMPTSAFVPNIFVSPEDVVWVEALASNPTSPVLPDLSLASSPGAPALDWRYSWMFTGQQTSSSNAASFDGNIVIFENRPFGIELPTTVPYPPGGTNLGYQVDGETVVEAVFGPSTNVAIAPGYTSGYGSAADRSVLLRWPDTLPDPLVRVGDWIADVTYERSQLIVNTRWWQGNTNANGLPFPLGVPNPANNLEWDNLPPQRCVWYQIQKVVPPSIDPNVAGHRSMTVYVSQSLQYRTLLDGHGNPKMLNAALIAPNVVNVIPQTIFVR